jgi:hypothetical protein
MTRDDTYLVDILESAKIAIDYVSAWIGMNSMKTYKCRMQ